MCFLSTNFFIASFRILPWFLSFSLSLCVYRGRAEGTAIKHTYKALTWDFWRFIYFFLSKWNFPGKTRGVCVWRYSGVCRKSHNALYSNISKSKLCLYIFARLPCVALKVITRGPNHCNAFTLGGVAFVPLYHDPKLVTLEPVLIVILITIIINKLYLRSAQKGETHLRVRLCTS